MSTNDKDSGPVTEYLRTGEVAVDKKVSEHRRKIIKASAAAVPAVMTLRSGAAAAITSSYQCFNHGPDTTNVDPVLGDNVNDPPHDEWVRMEAIPGYVVTGRNSKKYYGVRNPAYPWTEAQGWLWYLYNEGVLESVEPSNGNVDYGWQNNKTAIYCIVTEAAICWDEDGNNITSTVPGPVLETIKASTTTVYLLAYYDPGTGSMSYYPMPKEVSAAQPITESCMCSIDPISQLL